MSSMQHRLIPIFYSNPVPLFGGEIIIFLPLVSPVTTNILSLQDSYVTWIVLK